ncbi:prepilin-type N-terminal cleavage/methylation domain-containing protein [bacterium]|nr:prepilin-type N-terminal cleavage/methylation domain-containing protein [bacterium]
MILNRKPTRNSNQQAFTLIEVLFATVAFAIVLAAINTVFYGALRMRERSDVRFKTIRPQFQALEIIKQDLRATFYSEGFRADQFWCEPSTGLSVAADQLQFFTTTGTTSELTPWPDVQQIEYYLAPISFAYIAVNRLLFTRCYVITDFRLFAVVGRGAKPKVVILLLHFACGLNPEFSGVVHQCNITP